MGWDGQLAGRELLLACLLRVRNVEVLGPAALTLCLVHAQNRSVHHILTSCTRCASRIDGIKACKALRGFGDPDESDRPQRFRLRLPFTHQ